MPTREEMPKFWVKINKQGALKKGEKHSSDQIQIENKLTNYTMIMPDGRKRKC